MLPARLLYSILLFVGLSLAQKCDTVPCKEGCCSSSGRCGFGPDFCGASCVSNCDRKSECNPGFGAQWAQRDQCPLNACCSDQGHCGITEEFCGEKEITHQPCSNSSGNERLIGYFYFEGWGKDPLCNKIWPEQLPKGIYTHINFAHAVIDPKTFKISMAGLDDSKIYKRLITMKQIDTNLKVYITVGGKAFSDLPEAATTFSRLVARKARQKVFMESLLSFMSTYGFDGMDLDWEYPVVGKDGKEQDYSNFPRFMARLKTTLAGSGKGLTMTLPASYWYLRHYAVHNLTQSVDWFNIKTTGLHGTWKPGNEWKGAFLNSHTNLTEIDQTIKLLLRNNVESSKINLGLSFYGQTFYMTSPTCNAPGCTYASAGKPGSCTRQVGILTNSEIVGLIEEHDVTPILYEKEASKIAVWDNQWVSYDDEETLKMKAEYARSRCLGGLSVWAATQDSEDFRYSKALIQKSKPESEPEPHPEPTRMEDNEVMLGEMREALRQFVYHQRGDW